MKQQRIHLLLVEDDDLDVMNVHRALSQAPEIASITVARDGIEALRLLRAGELPLERLVILLDLRMPRMSGLDLLKELRSDPRLRRVPSVILTTSDDPVQIEQDLQRILPSSQWTVFSQRLLLHGRYICLARKPLCSRCPIYEDCDAREKAPR